MKVYEVVMKESPSHSFAQVSASSELTLLPWNLLSSAMNHKSKKFKVGLLIFVAALIITLTGFLYAYRHSAHGPKSESQQYRNPHEPPHDKNEEDFRPFPPGGSVSPRIRKGEPAQPTEFPYQVSLQAFNYFDGFYEPICGGVILDAFTVLTAAHCSRYKFDGESAFRIVAGEVDLSNVESSDTCQSSEVAHFLIHPQWDPFLKTNDIALLFLSAPLQFNEFVSPLNLPPAHHTIPQSRVMVVGWGTGGEGREAPSEKLQKINTTVYEKDFCRQKYGDDFKEEMLCAGSFDGTKDACPGDSGGPLVAWDLKEPYVAGIVSWGYYDCGIPGLVGFYTDVAHYVAWIHTEMKTRARSRALRNSSERRHRRRHSRT